MVNIEKNQAAFDKAGVTVVPIVMNPADEIKPDLARFGIKTPYLIDSDGSVSKGLQRARQGHARRAARPRLRLHRRAGHATLAGRVPQHVPGLCGPPQGGQRPPAVSRRVPPCRVATRAVPHRERNTSPMTHQRQFPRVKPKRAMDPVCGMFVDRVGATVARAEAPSFPLEISPVLFCDGTFGCCAARMWDCKQNGVTPS